MPPRATRSSRRYRPSRTTPTTGSVTAVSTCPSVGARGVGPGEPRGGRGGRGGCDEWKDPAAPCSGAVPAAPLRQVEARVQRVPVEELRGGSAGPLVEAVLEHRRRLGRGAGRRGGRRRAAQDAGDEFRRPVELRGPEAAGGQRRRA